MLEWDAQKERYKDLLREVEKERLARGMRIAAAAEPKGPSLRARVFLAIGQVMVRVGSRLEQFGRPPGGYADEIG